MTRKTFERLLSLTLFTTIIIVLILSILIPIIEK